MTCRHSLDDITGYRVVQTIEDGMYLSEFKTIAEFNPVFYGEAREVAEPFRIWDRSEGKKGVVVSFARILNMYKCGCVDD